MKEVFTLDFYKRKIVVEVGEISKQADGAVLTRYNDTVILSTACAAKEPKEGTDFFPLTVVYNEKQYSVGKIPQGFLRREGRPNEHATLSARLIDRPIRPMFSEGFRNEVQIINEVLSCDPDCTPEMTAMFGSSLALGISDIPFDGPIAGVQVGYIDGKFIINPSVEEKKHSLLNLTVAGTKTAINMVEAGANELPESVMLEGIMVGHKAIIELVKFQEKIIKKVGKAKRDIPVYQIDPKLQKEVDALNKSKERLTKAVSIHEKLERQNTIDSIEEEILKIYEEKEYKDEKEKKAVLYMVKDIMETVVKDEFRRLITQDKVRPDGRKVDEIRPLDAQVDLLPRPHGSAMFTRGQTQVISTCTLGPLADAQILDSVTGEQGKRWMHHYNFPPYAVGEIGRTGSPGRREIGHGALGERALSYVIPSEEDFPYTIRCVSEVVESNGSSSQASICASCMALMAAGVPIKAPVSGIAMGLITSGPLDGKHPYTILTDIQGMEDHLGDMDFKVAGTSNGVTALQMDIKIKGITKEILEKALAQAHKARAEILQVMLKAIPAPRERLSQYALKMNRFVIDKSKIREVIGNQGKVITKIIEENDNPTIDINDDGNVIVYHTSYDVVDRVTNIIKDIARIVKVGDVFTGKITRVENYGVFVNLFGQTEGMCHTSMLFYERPKRMEDAYKIGDTIKVSVSSIDESGKIALSHKEFEVKPEGFVDTNSNPFDNDRKKNDKKGKFFKKDRQ